MIVRMIGPLITGLMTTFRHMFKPKVAVNYPYEKVPMFPKYRGKQVLMRDENGLEKCVACGLCSVACPADAIYLEAEENDGTVSVASQLRPEAKADAASVQGYDEDHVSILSARAPLTRAKEILDAVTP